MHRQVLLGSSQIGGENDPFRLVCYVLSRVAGSEIIVLTMASPKITHF